MLVRPGAGGGVASLRPVMPWGPTRPGSLQIFGVGGLPSFGLYPLIWGACGFAVDRLAALLVPTLFAMGAAGLVLLLLDRIDATQYGVIKAASLVLLFALVMRWRSDRTTTRTAEAGA